MPETKLKRNLGIFSATTIVMGMVLGTGIFFKPQALYTATEAPGLGIIACALAGVITIVAALTSTELAVMITKTGGMTIWMEEVYGQKWSYLVGWFDVILFFPGSIAAFAIVFGTQVASLLGVSMSFVPAIGIAATLLVVLLNCLGNKTGAAVQNIFTVAKIVPIVLIIAVGLARGGGGVVRLVPITDAGHPIASSLGVALLACMFSYDGWIHISNISGELKNPKKNLPRAIIGGLVLYTLIFVAVNVAYLFAIPASELANSSTPAADVANVLFGTLGGKLITIGILISAFGVINGNVMTVMRIPYAMALENKLPGSKWLAKLNPKTSVPINAGILESVIIIICILSGTFNQLTDLVTFVNWIFYVMIFIAVIKMRKTEPDRPRPYKVPLYPVLPLVAICGGIFMLVSVLFSQPLNACLGIGLTLIGLPIYYARKNKIKVVPVSEGETVDSEE